MLKRAYSLLTIKSVDAEQRVLTGIATTPSTDSYGDIVEPEGAEYTLPVPLLWMHDSKSPVGEVFYAKTTPEGIEVKARILKTDTPGSIKTRLDDAWESLKIGLVKGLSIGFSSIEESFNKETGGYRFLRWAWRELSCVTVPANSDCSITAIRAASGAPHDNPAGASASTRTVKLRPEKPMRKSYADQIVDFQNARAAKAAKMDAILEKSADAGQTLDAAEKEEHDTLASEIKEIDEHLERLKAAEVREKAAALPVKGRTPDDGTQSRGTTRITVEKTLPPGIQFARYAMCMGMSRGNPFEAKELAKQSYGDDSAGLVKMIDWHQKGAVGALNAQTAGAGNELVPYTIMDDFINYLRPQTILGKFGTTVNVGGASGSVTYPSLRRVPFNTRVSGFSAGATASWVGEGLPALLSKGTSTSATLTWSKLAALTVLTKEEMRFSNPAAEAKVRDDLAASIIQKQDLDFIDPVRVAVANVSPASITWNTTPIVATGATAATFRTDMATLLGTFATALLEPSDIVIIMSTIDALNISLMITSLGNPVYPGMTMAGGYLFGFPVITTKALVSIGSPVSTIIVAVKAGDIYLADDGAVTVDASDQASIEMVDSSSQSGLTGTGASQVSLWQTGMVGLKATREINWKLRRTGAARYIYNAAYRT
jgi:HK97 family phage major capsid protein/HK97 family phage prohead protease